MVLNHYVSSKYTVSRMKIFTRVHSPEASDKRGQSFIKEILEMRQRCRRNVVRVSKKAAQLTA
ncbi:hypothetical protein T08_5988 [Trichinella sp. T8]|nr:hypothetical protein T08_5988 [Trichinella sp. T8]